MKKLSLFALVATMFVACATDATQDLAPEIPTAPDELYVSFDEEDTRIQLGDNGRPVWTAGDLVSVFYRSNSNDKYQFQGETGDYEGSIKLVEQGTATQATTKIVAVYPYNKDYWFNWNTGDVEAFLPAEQTYCKDSYGIGSSIMVSSSDYKQLSFKNVCGWLKLQFTGVGNISKITFKGNNGEQVAGEIYINTEDASCVLASDMGESSDGTGGNIVFDDTILTSVTLNCPTPVALYGQVATAFYIALPPQTFEKGFTVTLYGYDGTTKEISTSKEIVVERNHILPMATINEVQLPVANTQIWYTSTDGKVITPYKTDVFGANIVSNTYENGQGIITFDGEVTAVGERAFIGYTNNAYTDCFNLKSVIIPNSVTSIGEAAFQTCRSLTNVVIPNSVRTIDKNAFNVCSSLTTITIPDNVTTIGARAFGKCYSLTRFYSKYASVDGRCLIIDGTLSQFAPSGISSYTIPDNVTVIGESAFGDHSSLTSVIIPRSVKVIGTNAFRACDGLTNITIPNSVTSIEFMAFADCSALTVVYCEATNPSSLGSNVFSNNASGRKIYVPAGTAATYKAANGWKNYADAIVATSALGGIPQATLDAVAPIVWTYVADAEQDAVALNGGDANYARTFIKLALSTEEGANTLPEDTKVEDLILSGAPASIEVMADSAVVEGVVASLNGSEEDGYTLVLSNFDWDTEYNITFGYHFNNIDANIIVNVNTVDRKRGELVKIEKSYAGYIYSKDFAFNAFDGVAPEMAINSVYDNVAALYDLGGVTDYDYLKDVFVIKPLYAVEDIVVPAANAALDYLFNAEGNKVSVAYAYDAWNQIPMDVTYTKNITLWYGQEVQLVLKLNIDMPTVYNLVYSSLYVKNGNSCDGASYIPHTTINGLYTSISPNYYPSPSVSTTLSMFDVSRADIGKAFNIVNHNGIMSSEAIAEAGLVAEYELEKAYDFSEHNAQFADDSFHRVLAFDGNKLIYNADICHAEVTGNLYIKNSNGSRVRLTTNFDTAAAYKNFVVKGYNPILKPSATASIINIDVSDSRTYVVNPLEYITLKDYRNGYGSYDLIKNGSWVIGNGSNGFANGYSVRDIYMLNLTWQEPSIPTEWRDILYWLDDCRLVFDNSAGLTLASSIQVTVNITISSPWCTYTTPITFRFHQDN